VLLDLAGKAREAGEDTFTYGLMYQRQAGEAASMEQALPPFTAIHRHSPPGRWLNYWPRSPRLRTFA
jgi:hypothetical protein